jgi:predicted  nucleic acid-binding Zn-ribbon protein
MPSEETPERQESKGQQKPRAPDEAEPPDWAGIQSVGNDIMFTSEPDPVDPDHVVHISWVRRPDAPKEVTGTPDATPTPTATPDVTPTPDPAPDAGIPTPFGTFQCDQLAQLYREASAASWDFGTSAGYSPIEEADKAKNRVDGLQSQIAALDEQEPELYRQLNYWKQQADDIERAIQDYNDKIKDAVKDIERLEQEIARLQELQGETGDPDQVFERSIQTDQALIVQDNIWIGLIHKQLDALAAALQTIRQYLQQADDDILALEDQRQQLSDDLDKAKQEAALAVDRARDAQAEYDRLKWREQVLADALTKCPPKGDIGDLPDKPPPDDIDEPPTDDIDEGPPDD